MDAGRKKFLFNLNAGPAGWHGDGHGLFLAILWADGGDLEKHALGQENIRQASWELVINNLPAVLAIGGVLVYSLAAFRTDQFYGALGVSPSDVGVNFSNTLGQSTGLAISFLLIGSLVALCFYFVGYYRRRIGHSNRKLQTPGALLVTLVASTYVVAALLYALYANIDAEDIRNGDNISPGRIGPLIIAPQMAHPAQVSPAGKPEEAKAIEGLKGHKIVYLGQANGVVVLYDSNSNAPTYLPSSAVVMRVQNCQADSSAWDLFLGRGFRYCYMRL